MQVISLNLSKRTLAARLCTMVMAGFLVLQIGAGSSQATVYTRTASGNWGTTTAWSPNGVPSVTTDIAVQSATVNVTLADSAGLDASFTITQLQTNTGTLSYTLSQVAGGTGALVFDNTVGGTGSLIAGKTSSNSAIISVPIIMLKDTIFRAVGGTDGNTLRLNGNISGTAGLIAGGNTNNSTATTNVLLNAAATYTGSTTIRGTAHTTASNVNAGGKLRIGGTDYLPTGTILAVDGATTTTNAQGGRLDLFGNNQTVAGLSGTLGSSNTTGSIINAAAGTSTLTVNNTSDFTFNGVISSGTGAINLVKSGSGTETLAGTNTYTGATTVSGGTLLIASTGSINNTSGVTVTNGTFKVASGATALSRDVTVNGGTFIYDSSNPYSGTLTLSSGTVKGGGNLGNNPLTFNTGRQLSPGNSPGTLTTADQTWDTGGTYVWEINKADGTKGVDPGWDWTSITNGTGTLNITASAGSEFTIDIVGMDLTNTPGVVDSFDNTLPYSWTIATATGGISGFNATDFTLLTTNFTNNNDLGGGAFDIVQAGNDINLTFTPAVPEPASLVLIGSGIAGLLIVRRRRSSTTII